MPMSNIPSGGQGGGEHLDAAVGSKKLESSSLNILGSADYK